LCSEKTDISETRAGAAAKVKIVPEIDDAVVDVPNGE
jgi:hypothetical protein